MRKNPWGLVFLAVLAVNLVSIAAGNDNLQFISKCLLMPPLMLYAWTGFGKTRQLLPLLILALVFSWGGDIILLFQADKEIFFMLGLGSFLLAHIFYIILFHKIRVAENIPSKALFLLIVVLYYGGLMVFLNPWLGPMKIPVSVYGIVISFMFMLSMHLLYMGNKKAGLWIMAGALLFVLSDSTLAVNRFYKPFEQAGLVIMLTYGLAQFAIVSGVIQYVQSLKSNDPAQ